MRLFYGAWIDDELQTAEKAPTHEDSRIHALSHEIADRLSKFDIQITWDYFQDATRAYTHLERNVKDYRVAIIDCRFESQEHNWETLAQACEARSIPHVFFSNFLGDIDTIRPGRSHHLNIGRFDKGPAGSPDLVTCVCAALTYPSVRILHISDLHFSATLTTEAERDEQQALWDSAISTIGKEVERNPIDYLALSGDFGASSPIHDLPLAAVRVRELINAAVKKGIDRTLVIPGNHDIHWKDFRKGILAAEKWSSFLSFYQNIFSGYPQILTRLRAWDEKIGILSATAERDDLCWKHTYSMPHVSFVGLCSVSEDLAWQGLGSISPQQLRFLEDSFRSPRSRGEIRIALVHHNLFGVLSRSRLDDRTTIAAAGEICQVLLRSGIQLVLSGHSHVTNIVSFLGSQRRLPDNRLNPMGSLAVVSPGTFGGYHGARQQARTFLILEITPLLPQGRRRLLANSFVYDPTVREWTLSDDSPFDTGISF